MLFFLRFWYDLRLGMQMLVFLKFWYDLKSLGLQMVVFLRFWHDLKSLGLEMLVFLRFWYDLKSLGWQNVANDCFPQVSRAYVLNPSNCAHFCVVVGGRDKTTWDAGPWFYCRKTVHFEENCARATAGAQGADPMLSSIIIIKIYQYSTTTTTITLPAEPAFTAVPCYLPLYGGSSRLAIPLWEATPTPRVSRPTAVRTLHIHGVTDYGSYLSPLPCLLPLLIRNLYRV